MRQVTLHENSGMQISTRADLLFQEGEDQIHKQTDRMFVYLLVLQWVAGILAAVWISPRAWSGSQSSIHIHVFTAVFLGGTIVGFPIFLALTQPGRTMTRHAIAAAQMLSAGLLIHFTGGRVETHFQIFGLLAFLAYYRDWRVLLTATILTAVDHLVRGLLWPQSIYGVLQPSSLRWVEHASWVLFEGIVLLVAIKTQRMEMFGMAQRRAELEATKETIERKVVARTRQLTEELSVRKQQELELARTRDSALAAARLKSEFLANMSHEIRTPLNGIIGMTGILLDGELGKEQRECTEIIRSSGDSLLTLVNDILDFSKIEAGKLSFETLDFDIRETVEGVAEMLAERAQSKGLELVSLVRNDVPMGLRGDPGRLRQVLTNLIGNAIKFTEKGEVIVHTSLDDQTEHDAIIRFTVKDSGIGISQEGCQRLFQAFSQADGSTTRRYGGTGLGLAISKRLVELMGGEIGVSSTPGKGSTFWFTAKLGKQLQTRTEKEGQSADLSRLRVLIVDDNDTNRLVVQLQLKSWGIRSEDVCSAQEALCRLRQAWTAGRPFELVLLDMQMPDVDGLALAQQICADANLAATKMIMMTSLGNFDRERDSQLRAAGVSICLTKPVKQAKLHDTIVLVMTGQLPASAHTPLSASPSASPSASAKEEPRAPCTVPAEALPRKSPAHILVAEDNPINQKVILRQLAKLGYRADAVNNGAEALVALEQIKYDIVLMDCQMPEMDGYTATQKIRRGGKKLARVYIIALTAHTMQGDREKCLAAGMDDYLGKPIKTEELEEKLAIWHMQRQGKSSEKIQDPSEPQILDMSVLQRNADGDPAFLREMLKLYLTQGSGQIAELRKAVDESDFPAVEKIAHSLAGSSMCIGMRNIIPPLRRLESMARHGKLQEPDAVLQSVVNQFEQIQSLIATSPLLAAA